MTGYRTLAAKGEAELVIQRSRFIGRGFPVESEAAALAILADIRKAHWDASHNCFAYRIGPDGGCARYSDDGELWHHGDADISRSGIRNTGGNPGKLCG